MKNKIELTPQKSSVVPSIHVCLLIGLCFLWTGSSYLTWMYRIMDFYPDSAIDVLTEVIGYLFQILGLAVFSYLIKKKSDLILKKSSFLITILADFCFMIPAAFATSPITVLVWGYVLNLLHGLVAGFYLTALVTMLPQQLRGTAFGMGYGIGSIGSWILSLLGAGNFLQSPYVLLVYAALVLCTIGLLLPTKAPSLAAASKQTAYAVNHEKASLGASSKHLLLLAALTVFLLSTVKNMGFYFPTADLTNGGVSLEFTRVFYAVGLVMAGFLNDKNRKYGAVLCLATLCFPFVMLFLRSDVTTTSILWIVAYVFFGFFAVYRVLVFADLAGKSPDCLFLAGLGLLWGRAGDVLGGFAGMYLKEQELVLVLLVACLFFLTVFVFIAFYQKTYYPSVPVPETNQEFMIQEFAKRFQLSAREKEVLCLVIEGRSNGEIAGALYISENTVKFHIKNLLKKTQCSKRTELIDLFHQ